MAITDRTRAKASARQNILWWIGGDSSVAGANGLTGGWVKRLAERVAAKYDYNVVLRLNGSGLGAYPGPGESGYTKYVTSTQGPTAPQVEVLWRGMSGTAAWMISPAMASYGNDYFPTDRQIDLFLAGWGLNDFGLNGTNRTSAQFIADFDIIKARIRALHGPDAPILYETESPSQGGGAYTGTLTTTDFLNFFSDITQNYTGNRMPLSPYIQQSLTDPNFAIIDTWTPYGHTFNPAMFYDQVHPLDATYDMQAAWMFPLLAPDAASTPPTINSVQTSLGAMNRGVMFNGQIDASGGLDDAIWTVITGALPGGLTLSSTGLVSGIVTSWDSSYDFTVRVHTGNGEDTQRFTGFIYSSSEPFAPTGRARVYQKLNGLWYPCKIKVKMDGEFRQGLLRR